MLLIINFLIAQQSHPKKKTGTQQKQKNSAHGKKKQAPQTKKTLGKHKTKKKPGTENPTAHKNPALKTLHCNKYVFPPLPHACLLSINLWPADTLAHEPARGAGKTSPVSSNSVATGNACVCKIGDCRACKNRV